MISKIPAHLHLSKSRETLRFLVICGLMSSSLTFFKEFLRHPTRVGAVVPSSPELAEEMMRQAHVAECHSLAEFGSGTGVFTKRALQILPGGAAFISIEQNPKLVAMLTAELEQERCCNPTAPWCEKFPNTPVYCDTVENLPVLMKQHQLAYLDSIISGLPWASFNDELQDRLLGVALDSLRPGGYFATFAYLQGVLLPAGQHFYAKICQRFSSVERSKVIWKNLPPAFVYSCTK